MTDCRSVSAAQQTALSAPLCTVAQKDNSSVCAWGDYDIPQLFFLKHSHTNPGLATLAAQQNQTNTQKKMERGFTRRAWESFRFRKRGEEFKSTDDIKPSQMTDLREARMNPGINNTKEVIRAFFPISPVSKQTSSSAHEHDIITLRLMCDQKCWKCDLKMHELVSLSTHSPCCQPFLFGVSHTVPSSPHTRLLLTLTLSRGRSCIYISPCHEHRLLGRISI